MWALDFMGVINPPSSEGHKFILVAIEYYTKWVEAISLKIVIQKHIINFIKEYIICRFGIPQRIIMDNGENFIGNAIIEFCKKMKIDQRFSLVYYPQGNGQAEETNKTIKKILAKIIQHNGRDWHDRSPYALWAYKNSIRIAIGATPYSLVYGDEVIIPFEIEIPSLRIALKDIMKEPQMWEARMNQLEALDEKRVHALEHLRAYQQRISRAYGKKVIPKTFEVEDMVLQENISNTIARDELKGKFEPNWVGPYIILEAQGKRSYRLSTLDGEVLKNPINARNLKKYHI